MTATKSTFLFLTASSRPGGHTYKVMKHLADHFQSPLIDLASKDISYYDYEHHNADDDFLAIATEMTQVDIIVLGTPVYWYTMSAQMKTFLDRWSDLLTIRKNLGRALKGRTLALVSCGSAPGEVEGLKDHSAKQPSTWTCILQVIFLPGWTMRTMLMRKMS